MLTTTSWLVAFPKIDLYSKVHPVLTGCYDWYRSVRRGMRRKTQKEDPSSFAVDTPRRCVRYSAATWR